MPFLPENKGFTPLELSAHLDKINFITVFGKESVYAEQFPSRVTGYNKPFCSSGEIAAMGMAVNREGQE